MAREASAPNVRQSGPEASVARAFSVSDRIRKSVYPFNIAHDSFGEPVSTSPEHALTRNRPLSRKENLDSLKYHLQAIHCFHYSDSVKPEPGYLPMSRSTSLTPVTDNDFDMIEAAVKETERGRWFLSEYARRNRHADTQVLLGAITRLERTLAGERSSQEIERMRFDLAEMARAISRAKVEIAAMRPNGDVQARIDEGTDALDTTVRTSERATADILQSAEHIQEAAWTLRENGAEDRLCDTLDKRATDIYTACAFHDLTAQRTTKVVQVLRHLEGRINAMVDLAGPGEPAGEPGKPRPYPGASTFLHANAIGPSDIDLVIVDHEDVTGLSTDCVAGMASTAPRPATTLFGDSDLTFVDRADADRAPLSWMTSTGRTKMVTPASVMSPASAPLQWADDPVPDPFAAIDALDGFEKLRRFT